MWTKRYKSNIRVTSQVSIFICVWVTRYQYLGRPCRSQLKRGNHHMLAVVENAGHATIYFLLGAFPTHIHSNAYEAIAASIGSRFDLTPF